MPDSTILLTCNSCTEKIGSMDLDDRLVSPEEVIQFLTANHIYFMCDKCQCSHEFID